MWVPKLGTPEEVGSKEFRAPPKNLGKRELAAAILRLFQPEGRKHI
jgi:hypothetical protein